jgi:hypothetical protein
MPQRLQLRPQFLDQGGQFGRLLADQVFRQPVAGPVVAALGLLDGLADDGLSLRQGDGLGQGGEILPLPLTPGPAGAAVVAGGERTVGVPGAHSVSPAD